MARETSLFPDRIRTMSIDGKLLLSVLVLAGGGFASFVVLQYDVKAQTVAVEKIANQVRDVEAVVDGLDSEVDQHTKQIAEQARGLNWIGGALEALAEKQGVRLPNRPIVSED